MKTSCFSCFSDLFTRQANERGTICQWKIYERGVFSAKNGILKGKGSDLRAEPPRVKFFLVPPGP